MTALPHHEYRRLESEAYMRLDQPFSKVHSAHASFLDDRIMAVVDGIAVEFEEFANEPVGTGTGQE